MPIEVFPDIEALSRKAAELFIEISRKSIAQRGRFVVALSGGSTPKRLYELLGSEYLDKIGWGRVEVFFADERCVPPEHKESNFRLAYELFLSKVPAKIHRIKGEIDPEKAAIEYEKEISKEIKRGSSEIKKGSFGPLDLVVLGMGDDGHTASLFPGDTVALGQKRPIIPVYVDKLKSHRVTLTLPALNNSRNVVFLVAGRSKRKALRRIIEGKGRGYPAGLVKPVHGKLIWLVDEEAYGRKKKAGGRQGTSPRPAGQAAFLGRRVESALTSARISFMLVAPDG